MTNRNNRKLRNKTNLSFAQLEPRQCLSSVGWDGPGSGSAVLTYYVGPVPEGVDQATFDEVIEEALDVWAAVADVHFSKTDIPGQDGSLDITFVELDGQGGMLANAYFPNDVNPEPYAGDVQFDLSESWEIGNSRGEEAFDLMYVAVHEIGHALGLDHANVEDSIMHESVEPEYEFRHLTVTDVEAIHQLYGQAADDPDPPLDPQPPRDPVREPVVDKKYRFEPLEKIERVQMTENTNRAGSPDTTGSDRLAKSQTLQRQLRNDALDQWASEFDRHQFVDRAVVFESQEKQIFSIDLDSSLQPAELGSNLTSPIHNHLLSLRLLTKGSNGLQV